MEILAHPFLSIFIGMNTLSVLFVIVSIKERKKQKQIQKQIYNESLIAHS